ncbi:MAG: hypothetical protein ABI601_12970 [bacterium]
MTPDDTAVFAQIAFVAVTSLGALTGIGVAVHSYIQRSKRRMIQLTQGSIGGSGDRLVRLEQAVDSIAVEVERISEGQRFLTKLQTERAEDRALKP